MIASTYTILTKESTEVKVDPLDAGDLNPVIDIDKIENARKFMDNLKGGIDFLKIFIFDVFVFKK